MQKLICLSKMIIILSVFIFSLNIYADGDEERIFQRWFESKNDGVSKVKFNQYDDLCGSCHFSYQPGLLPGISWEKIMVNLNDHFGQPVKITNVETRTIMRYLLDNSAGHVNDKISNQMLKSLKYNPVPVRITRTPFFINKHNKIKNNMGQCEQCHQDAQQGEYNIESIHIPDQSQWKSTPVEFKM
ncbi:MAG: diheme cytochrome c [gamma proteobacterium symbiont of Taylorina sp.]|nr:diheme cytochrome c [gamma proteobacterium symbiont of Taylorina sp.]